jgi:hypothetical protein
MHSTQVARIHTGFDVPSDVRLRPTRWLAIVVLSALLCSVLLGSLSLFQDVSHSAVPPGNGPFVGARDPLAWPFTRDSIWNLPIGSNANYVWAGIRHATSMAYFTDADILVLKPTAPLTTVYTNYDDWGAGTRCASTGPAMFTAPIPANFVIPGSHMGSPDGDTPNAATAILAADGHTIIQTQPFARCAGMAPTSHYKFGNEDLYGKGETGSHGGSGLSALGGTVRLGELVPGGTIPHALKLNIDSANFYPGFSGYRWPAWKSDAGGAGYSGSIPEVRMGSLLAVKPDFPISTLESEPGRIVAAAFMNHGAYIVDTSGWSIYNFPTERSPDGSVQDEFARVWGYPLNTGVGANGWARDLDKIFTNLYVVDNWDYATWQIVSASNGVLGVGLGLPRVPWAPDFGQVPPPPPPPPPPPSLKGAALTLTTSKNPSTVNETVSVSGRLTDTSGAPIASRAVTLEWSGNQVTWYREAQIGQFPATNANGAFSGTMAFRGTSAQTDYIRANFAGDATYAASLSPVLKQSVLVPPSSPLQVSAAVAGTEGMNGWYVSPVTVALSTAGGAGATTITYVLDTAPSTVYRSPVALTEGRHALMFQASNASGSFGPAQYAALVVDLTAPTVEPISENLVLRPDAQLAWIGSDALSGIVQYEVTVDGGALRSVGPVPRLAGPWTIGSHTAVVKAFDGAGNSAMTTFLFGVETSAAPGTPTQPSPAPGIQSIVLPLLPLLGLISLILTAVAGLLYRRVRPQPAKKIMKEVTVRKVVRRVTMPIRVESVEYSESGLDCPL